MFVMFHKDIITLANKFSYFYQAHYGTRLAKNPNLILMMTSAQAFETSVSANISPFRDHSHLNDQTT